MANALNGKKKSEGVNNVPSDRYCTGASFAATCPWADAVIGLLKADEFGRIIDEKRGVNDENS